MGHAGPESDKKEYQFDKILSQARVGPCYECYAPGATGSPDGGKRARFLSRHIRFPSISIRFPSSFHQISIKFPLSFLHFRKPRCRHAPSLSPNSPHVHPRYAHPRYALIALRPALLFDGCIVSFQYDRQQWPYKIYKNTPPTTGAVAGDVAHSEQKFFIFDDGKWMSALPGTEHPKHGKLVVLSQVGKWQSFRSFSSGSKPRQGI